MLNDGRSREARRAIESLRAGVPNTTAVDALGVQEPEILDIYARRIERLGREKLTYGFFIEGDFGSGKSHILRYCESYALKRRLVASAVTISKETPLGDATAVYRSAVAGLVFPGALLGGSLGAIFDGALDVNSPGYATFYRDVCKESSALNPLFRASMQLYDRFRGSPEIVEQLIEFWDGGPAPVSAWKSLLKEVDAVTPSIKTTAQTELAPDRFQFAAMALEAAGYKGWLITVDEIELIAKFSLRARSQAYANIHRLFALPAANGITELPPIRGILFVGAITTDLVGELLIGRDDRSTLRNRSNEIGNSMPASLALAKNALSGFEQLVAETSRFAIRPLSEADLRQIQDRISDLYHAAYRSDFSSDSVHQLGMITTMSHNIRQNVRGWIAFWDLKRIYPTYSPNIVAEDLMYDLSEDDDLPEEATA